MEMKKALVKKKQHASIVYTAQQPLDRMDRWAVLQLKYPVKLALLSISALCWTQILFFSHVHLLVRRYSL